LYVHIIISCWNSSIEFNSIYLIPNCVKLYAREFALNRSDVKNDIDDDIKDAAGNTIRCLLARMPWWASFWSPFHPYPRILRLSASSGWPDPFIPFAVFRVTQPLFVRKFPRGKIPLRLCASLMRPLDMPQPLSHWMHLSSVLGARARPANRALNCTWCVKSRANLPLSVIVRDDFRSTIDIRSDDECGKQGRHPASLHCDLVSGPSPITIDNNW